jgi:hypothetical protein
MIMAGLRGCVLRLVCMSESCQACRAGSILVAADMLEPKSQQPCPLAGKSVSRNTKCSLTNRRFKACCGRG